MPDDSPDQELIQALGPSFSNYAGPEELEVEGIPTAPDPTATPVAVAPEPTPVPAAPVQPVTPPPDLTGQQRQLEDQQAHLTLTQQMNQAEQQYLTQGADPNIAKVAAENWATAQWAQYQQNRTIQQADTVAKQQLIGELSREHGIDATLLNDYTDRPSMTAAARQFGEMAKVKKQVTESTAVPKVPVQDFAGGSGTPLASTQREAIDYMQGRGGVMTREKFIQVHGFDPT